MVAWGGCRWGCGSRSRGSMRPGGVLGGQGERHPRSLFALSGAGPVHQPNPEHLMVRLRLNLLGSPVEADLAAAPNQAVADSIGPLIETELDRVTNTWERALRAGDSSNDLLSRIAEEAKDLRVKRKGSFLDLAAGAVWEFPGKVVDEKSLLNWGAWLTGGYEGTSTSALGLFRVLGDRPRDEVMFDVGLRVLVDQAGGFSASVEALHRWDSTQDDGGTWRTAGVLDYALPSNRAVSMTLGRDFAESTESQILAAINFAVGLGSARPLR